jgi:hypothetical protein
VSASSGVQLITIVLPQEKTTPIECFLLSKIGSTGAFERTSLIDVDENLNFKKGETLITVLLMNPEAKE